MAKRTKKKVSKKAVKKVLVTSTTSSKPRINGAKKGKQFERDISNALGHIFPAAERMLEYQASGNIGIDIQGTGNFKIQCKRNAGYASVSKIHEVRSKDKNDIPILVTKGNRMDAMAVLPFDNLVYMLEVMHGLKPLLRKPEDDADKTIHSESVRVVNVDEKHIRVEIDCYPVTGIQGKDKVIHEINSSSMTLLGIPMFEDNELEFDEITLAGDVSGNEAYRLLNYPPNSPMLLSYAIAEMRDMLSLEGMNVRAIHCGSISHFRNIIDSQEGCGYSTRTLEDSDRITSLSDLI